jgi:hypothetical protein
MGKNIASISSNHIVGPEWDLILSTKEGDEVKPLITLGFLVLVFFLASGWAQAAVIYDESVSGDLDWYDTLTIDLQVGANSLLGSAHLLDNGYDFDSFIIFLGDGLILTNIDFYIIDRSINENTTVLGSGYMLNIGSHDGTFLERTEINLLGTSPHSMFESTLPLTGSFSFAITNEYLARQGIEGSFGSGGSWDYEFRFTVEGSAAPVPEPSTLPWIPLLLLND